MLEIEVTNGPTASVVGVGGAVDAATAPDLLTSLEGVMGDGASQLVVDLANVEYMSSAGLRTLLGAVKQARGAGGDLRLAAPQASVKRVLDMSGFTGILKTFDTVEDALGSIG